MNVEGTGWNQCGCGSLKYKWGAKVLCWERLLVRLLFKHFALEISKITTFLSLALRIVGEGGGVVAPYCFAFDIISILSWLQVLRKMVAVLPSSSFSTFNKICTRQYLWLKGNLNRMLTVLLAIGSNNSLLLMDTKVYVCCLRHHTLYLW